MNQVLGHDVGNALEVREAVDFLTGRRRETRLHAVTSALAREMLVLGGLARDHGEAAGPVERALDSGAAAERFARMVAALGGPADFLERPDRHLAGAPVRLAVTPEAPGSSPGGRATDRPRGDRARRRPPARRDPVDPAVGLADMRGPGMRSARIGPSRWFTRARRPRRKRRRRSARRDRGRGADRGAGTPGAQAHRRRAVR